MSKETGEGREAEQGPGVTAEPQRPQRERLVDIDHVKALAIVLVVYGHIVAREGPQGDDWYVLSKNVLYFFHMPLFMFVSGLLMAYTMPRIEKLHDYGRYVRRRAGRLLPAYFILALIIVFGKVAASRFMHVDNVPDAPANLLFVLTRPYESATAFLWYVYVIFLYCVSFPALIHLVGRRTEWLLLLGLILYFLPRTNAFGMGQYTEYFVFFASGVVASKRLPELRLASDRGLAIWASAFAALILAIGYGLVHLAFSEWGVRLGMLALGFVAIPLFIGAVRLKEDKPHPTLDLLGKYTFTIYLFNTLFIGLVKGLGAKEVSWDGWHFFLYLPVLWCAGVLFPILLHRIVLSRLPRLGAITI